MVSIRQNLVSASKYSTKCPYEMAPQYITIHNTANDASAANEISYMIGNNDQVSYHYAVDDKEIIQGILENRNAWHAGDGGGDGNRKSIGIEICYSKSGGERFTKAEANAAEFTAYLLKQRNWNISRVKKHQDWSGKYCPHRTLDMGWQRFLNMIQKYLDSNNGSDQEGPAKVPDNTQMYRIRLTWNDSKSQKGAYQSLDNAKQCADKNPGYSVFDKDGKAVYKPASAQGTYTIVKGDTLGAIAKKYNTTVEAIASANGITNPDKISIGQQLKIPGAVNQAPDFPYTVKITCDVLNVRKGAGTGFTAVQTVKKNEIYTITEAQNGWGKLKSGAGWISLEYTQKI